VRESVSRVINSKDRVSTQLKILEILLLPRARAPLEQARPLVANAEVKGQSKWRNKAVELVQPAAHPLPACVPPT